MPPEIPPSSQVLLGRKGNTGSSSSSSSSSGSSHNKPAAPLQGVVELGGASLQVTFAAKEQLPAGQAAELVLPRLGPDRLYSRSFDGLGLQVSCSGFTSLLDVDFLDQCTVRCCMCPGVGYLFCLHAVGFTWCCNQQRVRACFLCKY
jgi:hypothetical protein